jgi:hypothetical protein
MSLVVGNSNNLREDQRFSKSNLSSLPGLTALGNKKFPFGKSLLTTATVAAATIVGKALFKKATSLSKGKLIIPDNFELRPGDTVVMSIHGVGYDFLKFKGNLKNLKKILGDDQKLIGYFCESAGNAHDVLKSRSLYAASLVGKLSPFSKHVSFDLATQIKHYTDLGVNIVIVAHSLGCLFASESVKILEEQIPDGHKAFNNLRIISLGSPLKRHHGDKHRIHVGIMNLHDKLTKINPNPDRTVWVQAPNPDNLDPIYNHFSKNGYFVPGGSVEQIVKLLIAEPDSFFDFNDNPSNPN